MKALAIALGAVCLATGVVIAVLAVAVFLDEWQTPKDLRRPK